MDSTLISILILLFVNHVSTLPVDPSKETVGDKEADERVEHAIDELGLEYGRYLQQVAAALEEDKDFAKKLANISYDQIKSGVIAKDLNFVNHNVRNKLDELKRVEMERLRKLTKQEHKLKADQGWYSIDGRRWRTVDHSNPESINSQAKFDHVDHQNPHTFEIEDLHRLIVKATQDLEDLDKKRREEFKQYEMEKEYQFQESLKNMTDDQKKEAMKKHDDLLQKHKDHPRVHHPGSKAQLEEVWEEKDHMPKEEFNPKLFFALHDINSDGYLDQEEVEALLSLEVKKMYDPNNPEDDPNEMMEEFHRMREHIYQEADKDRDGLISLKEFIELTKRGDFEKDDGWKGIDEAKVFNNDDMKHYEERRAQLLQHQYGYYVPDGYMGVPSNHPYQFVQPNHMGGQPVYYVDPYQAQMQGMHPNQMSGHPQMNVYPNQPNGHPNQVGGPQGHPSQIGGPQGHVNQFGMPQGQYGSPQGQPNEMGAGQRHPNQIGSPQGQANQPGGGQLHPNAQYQPSSGYQAGQPVYQAQPNQANPAAGSPPIAQPPASNQHYNTGYGQPNHATNNQYQANNQPNVNNYGSINSGGQGVGGKPASIASNANVRH